MLRVGLASLQEVDNVWPLISQGLEKACKRCNEVHCAGDLWQMCRSGHAFLILVYDDDKIWSAGVWRFQKARPGHSFRCVMMYGENMRGWVDMARDFITKIAKDNGAVALVAEGRAGWSRVFGAEKHGLDYEVKI